MSDSLYFFLQTFVNIVALICVSGFAVYQFSPKITSWEAGVIKIVSFPFKLLYEELVKKPALIASFNPALILTNEEAITMVQRLNRHPYDTPVLVTYISNQAGISWYDISSCGLISIYKDISRSDLIKLCTHVICQYFLETRNIMPLVYVKVASPNRLYFAIPLSNEGKAFLDKQQQDVSAYRTNDNSEILEEEIILFDTGDSENDSRI